METSEITDEVRQKHATEEAFLKRNFMWGFWIWIACWATLGIATIATRFFYHVWFQDRHTIVFDVVFLVGFFSLLFMLYNQSLQNPDETDDQDYTDDINW
jgi:hypothetical protein